MNLLRIEKELYLDFHDWSIGLSCFRFDMDGGGSLTHLTFHLLCIKLGLRF